MLPECAVPGYMFDSAEEALPFAEEIPGPSTEALAEACRRLDAHVVCGLLERDGDVLHNAAVLVGPDGLVGTYRKTHLPFLGVDRFVEPGRRAQRLRDAARADRDRDLLRPALPGGDRTLALQGADLVAHPTNFPVAAQRSDRADHRRPRGREPDLPADGEPRRQGALGRVLRLEPDRRPVRHADSPRPTATEEALLVADVDVEKARDKDYVVPGDYELYLFGDRRPELYGALVEEPVPIET